MKKGYVLPVVAVITLVVAVTVPTLVNWTSQQSKSSVDATKRKIAFNLAEAAQERAIWMIKKNPTYYEKIVQGLPVEGLNFDVTYNDLEVPGHYRIKVTSGTTKNEIVIITEGKDIQTKEVEAIKVVYKKDSINAVFNSINNLTINKRIDVHWGPVNCHANITMNEVRYYPFFYAKGAIYGVSGGEAILEDPLPPNTFKNFNAYWEKIPPFPAFDFQTLKTLAMSTFTCYLSVVRVEQKGNKTITYYRWRHDEDKGNNYVVDSATQVTTYNVFRCNHNNYSDKFKWWREFEASGFPGGAIPGGKYFEDNLYENDVIVKNYDEYFLNQENYDNYLTPTAHIIADITETKQPIADCNGGTDPLKHVQSLYLHPAAKKNRVWFWDKDVVISGDQNKPEGGCGIIGTIVVKGNLRIDRSINSLTASDKPQDNPDIPPLKIPSKAYEQYKFIDTAAINEYPGDDGLGKNKATYNFVGNDKLSVVGVVIVAKDDTNPDSGVLSLTTGNSKFNVYGAVAVQKRIEAVGQSRDCSIFFNEDVDVPTLDLNFSRKRWEITKPSNEVWAQPTPQPPSSGGETSPGGGGGSPVTGPADTIPIGGEP